MYEVSYPLSLRFSRYENPPIFYSSRLQWLENCQQEVEYLSSLQDTHVSGESAEQFACRYYSVSKGMQTAIRPAVSFFCTSVSKSVLYITSKKVS